MPFKSDRQCAYLWINKPKAAKKFSEHGEGSDNKSKMAALKKYKQRRNRG